MEDWVGVISLDSLNLSLSCEYLKSLHQTYRALNENERSNWIFLLASDTRGLYHLAVL